MGLAENPLVVRLELLLRRRQRRALRVVDEVEDEAAALGGVAERVQPLEALDASFVDPFAALPVDQLRRVARQRGRDLDFVFRQEGIQVLLAGLAEDGQVAAVDDVRAELPRTQDEVTETRMKLGRAARDIQLPDRRNRKK